MLRLCAAAGLVSVGTIAIDGTKIGAAAALDKNRGPEWLRAEVRAILAQADATDAAEDAQPGLFGADVLPVELSTHTGRLARLEAALAQIEAQDSAARVEAETRAAKAVAAAAEGHELTGRKPKDPHAALARAEAEHAAALARAETRAAQRAAKEQAAAAQGRTLSGFPPRPDDRVKQAAAALEAARVTAAAAVCATTHANVTDADSRIMKTAAGVQGDNAQAAVNENQIVVAHAVSQDANDVQLYQPMVTAIQDALVAVGVSEAIGAVLADAGYWSDDNATAHGPDRLIATLKDWKQRRAARDMARPLARRPRAPRPSKPWSIAYAPRTAPRPTPSAPIPSSRSSPTTNRTGVGDSSAAGASTPCAASGR